MRIFKSAKSFHLAALVGAFTLAGPAKAAFHCDVAHPITGEWTMVSGPGGMARDLELHMQLGWVAAPVYPAVLTSGGLNAPLPAPPNAPPAVSIPFVPAPSAPDPIEGPNAEKVRKLRQGKIIYEMTTSYGTDVDPLAAGKAFDGGAARLVELPDLATGQTVFTTPEKEGLPALQVKIENIRGNYTTVRRYDSSGYVDRSRDPETLHTASLAGRIGFYGYRSFQEGDHVVDATTRREGVIMAFYTDGHAVILDKNDLRHYRVKTDGLRRLSGQK